MGLIALKHELNKCDKATLIGLISDLYKKDKSVKEYLEHYLNPNEEAAFIKYRDQVYEAFFPKRGYNFKLRAGKQSISEFKKLDPSPALIADLMLFYVETGVALTQEIGDINEAYYSSMESTYLAALKLMKKENLLAQFSRRAEQVVDDAKGIGWGFYDTLGQMYYEFYN